jgi:hypothetical protein
MRAELAVPLLLAVAWLALACKSQPDVVPFPDSGDPCSHPNMQLDCGQFADVTCHAPGDGGCEVVTYGCFDAGFFVSVDTSRCPEGGLDGGLNVGDSSLIKGDGSRPEGGD